MNHVSFARVFHPTDFSPSDAAAFAHALRIALAGEELLTLYHCDPNHAESRWEDFPHVRTTMDRWKHLLPPASQQGLEPKNMRILKVEKESEEPLKAILSYVRNHILDLIVMATHQRQGLDRVINKSLAEPIARQSHLKTLFVPRQGRGFVDPNDGALELKHVLVPVDFSPKPQLALDAAASLLRLFNISDAEISILHIGEGKEGPPLKLPQDPGWRVHRYLVSGNAIDNILEVAKEQRVDLISMGTQGHNGFLDALRGSTTEQVVREALCPVLAVPAA